METEKFTSFLQFFFGERKVDRVDCLFVLELKGLCHTALYTGTSYFLFEQSLANFARS
jgi:hypothetical protein